MKVNKFLFLCSTFSVLLIGGMSISMEQRINYDTFYTKPLEQIESLLGFDNKIKNKYKFFIEQDKQVLATMSIPNNVLDTYILFKQKEFKDELLFPLMEIGQFLTGATQKEKNEKFEEFLGIATQYVNKTGTNTFNELNSRQTGDEHISIGINEFEKKDQGSYADLYSIFEEEQKVVSFVFYHEFAHALSKEIYTETNSINNVYKKIQSNGISLTPEIKSTIAIQYNEAFADMFAFHMMAKRYPSLNIEKAMELFAGSRFNDIEATHLTSLGLLSSNPINKNDNLTQVIKNSLAAAYKNINMYTQLYITQKQTKQELSTENISEKIQNARQSFINKKKLKVL